MQAQYSTQEQLENLRAIFDRLEKKPVNPFGLMRLANKNGLYDAADHIDNVMLLEGNGLTTQQWDEDKLRRMMEW
jgi:hypothetical protein